MVTSGFFQQQLTPNYRIWTSDKNVEYIQYEVQRRLAQEFQGSNQVTFSFAKQRLVDTLNEWRGPLTQSQLLELVICDLVSDIRTEIEQNTRFDNFDPLNLYNMGTGITREEKVKLRKPRKFEFIMRY